MATFRKKVFIGAAAALFIPGSTGLNLAEGAAPNGAGARAGIGAGVGGSAGSISMATAVSLGVMGLGFIALAADGDSGGTTSIRPPVNPPGPTTTTRTTTTGTQFLYLDV